MQDTAMFSVECPKCGYWYDINRRAIVSGSWKDCPVCTPAKVTIMTPAQLLERHGDEPDAA